MEECRIQLMPRAEETYRELRMKGAKFPADTLSPRFCEMRAYANMLKRVNIILFSLLNPRTAAMDQPLLEALSWIKTRTEDSTLVYFLRLPNESLPDDIKVLHITDCENSTASYARFSAFISSGGWQLLRDLGFKIPANSIGSSAMIQ